MKQSFYRCDTCANLAELILDSGVNPVCCGKPMRQLKANTTDAAQEKHVPAVEQKGKTITVQIGGVIHPMTPEHYIQWIMVTQGEKTQRVQLSPDDEPKAEFILDSETEPYTVYEYCNLHGLWKKES